jgi:hypothetical protein
MAQGDLRGNLTASANSITNPTNLTGSVAVSVGDLVYVAFSQQTNLTATGASDNLGNTYAAVNAGTDGGTPTHRAFYSRVTNAGTLTTISVAATASTNDVSAVAAVIEGPFLTSPLDANPANTTDGTTPFTCPATGTLAQAEEVIMASIGINSNQTVAASSPFTLSGTVARANISTGVSRQKVSATTTQTPEFTGTTAAAVQTTASFKLAPVLAADPGSFDVTGSPADLELGREVLADPGSYAITGAAATLSKGYPLSAGAGSFAVSGQATDLEYGRELAAEAGSFGFTGADATLYVATPAIQENLWPNSEVLPFDAADSLNVTLTSNTVVAPDGATTAELLTESTDGSPTTHTFGELSLAPGDQVTVTPGGWYTFSFYAKAVTGTRNLLLEFYTTTGTSVFSVALNTTTGAVDVSASDGYIGAIKLAHSEAAANGFWRVGVSLYFDGTLTGGWGVGGWGEGTWGTETTASLDPIVFDAVYGEIRDGTTPTYTGNGSSVALWGFQINRGVPWATYLKTPITGRTIVADPGSFAVSGVDAALELGREVLAGQGSFLVTGTAADLEYAREVAAEAGAFAVNGVDANLERGREVLALAGSFVVNGVDVFLELGREVVADPGSYAVGGVDAGLERGYEIAADPGAFGFSGTDATLVKAAAGARFVTADPGAFTFLGVDAALEYGFELTAGPGVYEFVGTDATLEQGTVAPSLPVTGGGSSAAPKDEWWRSPPTKKKRRKAAKTDTGAPTEAPLSVSERLARRQKAEEAARLAAEALVAAKDALDAAIRNKVAADAIKALKAEAARRKRIAAAAQAAIDAEIEAERRAAIMADDDLVLLFAA